jgi:hypothetical protein
LRVAQNSDKEPDSLKPILRTLDFILIQGNTAGDLKTKCKALLVMQARDYDSLDVGDNGGDERSGQILYIFWKRNQ